MNLKDVAKDYFEMFGFNLLPLENKVPKVNWERWQCEEMSILDINSFSWNGKSNGIGAISGIKKLRCLDFDCVTDYTIVKQFLRKLGLPSEYIWVVKSGSGKGYHIWFCCMDYSALFKVLGGEKAYYKLKLKETGKCDHIELRWKNCQTVLPPSLHPSGNMYTFVNRSRWDDHPSDELTKVPARGPNNIDVERLVRLLDEMCVVEGEKLNVRSETGKNPSDSTSSNLSPFRKGRNPSQEKIGYDKDRLESALSYLSQTLPGNCYDEWYRIGFALVSIGPAGEKYFVDMSLKNPHYNDTEAELKKKFAKLKNDYNGKVTLGTLYHLAESYGWKKPVIRFWSVDDNGKVKINRTRYKRFLESEGFCKYKLDSNYFFVRIENNIVEEIDCIDVKEFVMNYIDRLPIDEFNNTNKADVIDALIKAANQLFTMRFLEFLITRRIEFNQDTSDKGYFYFKNGFVEISTTEVKFNNFKKLERHIWKRQIINRNYIFSERRSVFEELLFNICRSNKQRYDALKSGIGYLLHTYKSPAITKAVVFIDEKLSDGAFGRSGKGLVIKAISQVRNVIIEDGRNFNPSKNFAFQRVKADTNIIAIEDIRDKFPFERMFSIITEGIVVERKNKDEVFIPYSESPKVVLSTNFSISGIDDSTVDRQFIIEFSDYYNRNHRPVDDFGKLFFDHWYEDEWNDFDCFMIECIQFYLRRGLILYEYVNINQKKLIDGTAAEFNEFSQSLEPEKEYDKKELYEAFIKEYSDFNPKGTGKLTQGKFTRWLKIYARVKGYEIREGKSGVKRTVEFANKEKGKIKK